MTTLNDSASSRRQFLLGGSALLAGAVLLGSDLVAAPGGLAALAAAPGPRVPVAYIEGSQGRSVADVLVAGARALPVASVRGPGSIGGNAAVLTVHGFASPGHATNSAFAGVLVDALIQSPAHRSETIPYFAFTSRNGAGAMPSSPTRLRMAAVRGERVGLRVTTLDAGAVGSSTSRTSHVVFGSNRSGHVATVRPGVYLLGLQDGLWTRPVSLPAAGDAAWAGMPSVVVVVEAEAAS